MDTSEQRRSKREHQPSAKVAAASLSSAPAVVSSSSRRSQRRRVTLSASPVSTPVPTRNSSPSPVPITSTSSSSSDIVAVVVDAVGPNGQRRRVRAAAHTGVNTSVTHGVHDDGRVLGRYSSRDCALLCEVILGQLKRQTLESTVLEEEKSPAFIQWGSVAKKMETTHKLRVTPKDCQILWKFLAYGQLPSAEITEKLLPDSDEEDFHKTPKEINGQLKAERATEGQVNGQGHINAQGQVNGQVTVETPQSGIGQDKSDTPTLSERESSVCLYPTYSLPTGAPDTWHRPFGAKDALPLTFVASRFLKRKANSMQSMYSKATTGTTSASNVQQKQVVPAGSTVANKKPKLSTSPVSTTPRVFAPSSTPPPAPKRAHSELEFFESRLRTDLSKNTPASTFDVSAADVQRRFDEASADVKRECQMLAAHDVERFNREVVRLRIWQKAMGPTSAKPTAAAKSTPVTAHVNGSPHSLVSTATTLSRSLGPAISHRSGPTAALLAHTAAVVAKTQTTECTDTVSKTTQERKERASAIN